MSDGKLMVNACFVDTSVLDEVSLAANVLNNSER